MAIALREYKPAMAMILVQSIYAGMSIFSKAAFKEGMKPPVFVVYRQAIATLVLIPATIVFRRGLTAQMSMGWRGYCMVFVASLVGVTMNQYFYYQGLHLATSSMATAMLNIVPAVTFVMAASLGMEKVALRSVGTMAKVSGTMICIGGAFSMGVFKGPKILNIEIPTLASMLNSIGDQWTRGFLFLAASTSCWSTWLILQVPICKEYMEPLPLSALMCFFSTCQSAILTFFLVPDLGAWRITSILELLSCLFVGIFGSGVTFYLQSWTISVRGPLFSSVFNPLCTVITTIVSVPLLHEELYIGSLVGAVAVVCGLYIVLWGKARDFDSESKPEEDYYANTRDVGRGSCNNRMKEPLIRGSLLDAESQIEN